MLQVPDLSLQAKQYRDRMGRSAYSLVNKPAVFTEQIEYDFWSVQNSHPWLEALLFDHVSGFTPEGLRYILDQGGLQVESVVQSTADRVTWEPGRYSWPVDIDTGNTPNSVTVMARK